MTTQFVTKENAWNQQKHDLIEREIQGLRREFVQKEEELRRLYEKKMADIENAKPQHPPKSSDA